MSHAFVTLATTDEYAIGALVLSHSLRESGTKAKLVVMITADGVSPAIRGLLQDAFDHVEVVDVMNSGDQANLKLLSRPDLGVTFTKLHCWRLTQFEKAVFMDADTLVLRNVDNLFEYEELSAAPDPGWPDCFNSGVFVYRPSQETYSKLVQFALKHGSFDGGDQGLLNQYFHNWVNQAGHRLSFVFNCIAHTFYSYSPALQRFRENVRVVHFIGAVKPWHYTVSTHSGQVLTHDKKAAGHSADHLQLWWNTFLKYVVIAMSKVPEFRSRHSCSLPSGMHLLIIDLINVIHSRSQNITGGEEGRSSGRGGYDWFFSGRLFGERHIEHAIGFPFLQIHRPKFEVVHDYSFLHSHGAGGSSRKTTGQAHKDKASSSSEPIVRYFITIGHDAQSHMSVVSPEEWHRMMKEEGLLEAEELDDEFGWSSYSASHGRMARLELPPVEPGTFPPVTSSERERQYAWERNEIDYTGQDRFDAILDKINAAIHPPPK